MGFGWEEHGLSPRSFGFRRCHTNWRMQRGSHGIEGVRDVKLCLTDYREKYPTLSENKARLTIFS